MKIPVIEGLIERRILVNYTAAPEAVSPLLPAPFAPKLHNGKAIVGICLIRLKAVRPKGLPAFMGIASENGAHRIAVTWQEGGLQKEGVYIPRRDTSSRLNSLAGGRIFPGRHVHAKFNVKEGGGRYQVAFTSQDQTHISIDAKETSGWPSNRFFDNLAEASCFFENGADGFSPNGHGVDGLRLQVRHWQVQALDVSSVRSSFFENEALFPKGSIQFDHALLMKNIPHEWHSI